MFGRIGNFVNTFTENQGEQFDLEATASQGELNDLLRQFQHDQAKVTREYQKMLTEKERELALYKEACALAKIEVAKVKMDKDDNEDKPADSEMIDAKLSSAIREKRLIERVKFLEAEIEDLKIKVSAHERNIEALERELEFNESERVTKDKTIEDLVLEYSQLSSEMREASEKDLNVIAELEQDKNELEREVQQYKDSLQQVTESANLLSQVTGSGDDGNTKLLKDQVSDLNIMVRERNNVIETLQAQLSEKQLETPMPEPGAQSTTAGNEELLSAQKEIEKLRAELASASSASSTSGDELKKQKLAADQEIEKLRAELASASSNMENLSKSLEEAEKSIKNIQEEYTLKQSEVEETHKAELLKEFSKGEEKGEEVAREHFLKSSQQSGQEALVEHEKEIQRLHDEKHAELESLTREHDSLKEKAIAELMKESSLQLEKLEEEKRQLLEAKESEVKALKDEHSKALAEKESVHEKVKEAEAKISELTVEHEAALTSTKEASEAAIKELEEAHAKAVAAAMEQAEAKHLALQGESESATLNRLNEELAAQKKKHDEALDELKSEHEKKANELSEAINVLEADKNTAHEKVKEAEAKISELTVEHEAALTSAKEASEAAIKELEEAHAKAVAAAEESLRASLEGEHKAKLESMVSEHKESLSVALAGAEMEAAANLEMLKDKHETALSEAAAEKASLIEKHESALSEAAAEKASLIEKHEAALSEAAAEKASLIEKHETALSEAAAEKASLVEKHETALSEAAAEKASLVEKHQGEMLEAAASHEAKLAEITSEFESKVSECESKLEEANTKIASLDAEFKLKLEEELKQQEEELGVKHRQELVEVSEKAQVAVDQAELQRKEAYDQYLAENKKRKEIHNKLIEIQGNIRVFARCRPMVDAELRSGKCEDVTEFPTPEDIVINKGDMLSAKAKFEFDACFKPDSEQVAVFEHVSPFITSFLDGYNVCIFAYGQTGSGKTFTMEGPAENRGVNLRSIAQLFELSAARSAEMTYEFTVSYLEIYNEAVYDLLGSSSDKKKSGDRGKGLDIRGGETGISIPGLSCNVVTDIDQVLDLMAKGAENRAVGSHDMNEHSSRSHSILTLTCSGTPVDAKKSGLTAIKSKLHLIDLAGSERISKTDATGERLKEAQAINKSLSALGDVISALGGKKGTHVPYRNSKLTFLLQDSLSGNSKVLMFCNVSPASYNVSETLCTLGFAARCRNVELGQAKKGVETSEVKKLKNVIRDLENQLAEGGGKGAAAEPEATASTPSASTKKSPSKSMKSPSMKEKK